MRAHDRSARYGGRLLSAGLALRQAVEHRDLRTRFVARVRFTLEWHLFGYDSLHRRWKALEGRRYSVNMLRTPEATFMEFPFYFHFGSASLHPHWLLETLAWTVAFWWYSRRRRAAGDVVDSRSRTWVIAAAAVGGLLGSRLLYLLEDPSRTAANWSDASFLFDGKTIVGGLIGGLMAVEWIKARLGVTVATGDLLAVPLIVGIAIGRIGCFLSGLDDRSYGTATRLPWGVDFGDGVPRHPAQMYEIAFLAALGFAIARLRSRAHEVGDQFKVFMIGYMAWRLAIDFMKPGVPIAGLSAIQWACLAMLAYYAPHLPRLSAWGLRPKREPEVIRG